MTTIVFYNGSRFAGSDHASIDALLELIELEPLNWDLTGIQLAGGSSITISGNFVRISHAFRIQSDNPEVLDRFRMALDLNQSRNIRSAGYGEEPSARALYLMRDTSLSGELLGLDLDVKKTEVIQ